MAMILISGKSLYRVKVKSKCKTCHGKGLVRHYRPPETTYKLKFCSCVEVIYHGELATKQEAVKADEAN